MQTLIPAIVITILIIVAVAKLYPVLNAPSRPRQPELEAAWTEYCRKSHNSERSREMGQYCWRHSYCRGATSARNAKCSASDDDVMATRGIDDNIF